MNAPSGRVFDRVVVIMFENEFRGYVQRNPYMRSLAEKGIDLANYFGVMHPSNTNYLASVAGEICNVTRDPLYYTFLPMPQGAPPPMPGPTPLPQTTVADSIAAKGLGWRAYLESYSKVDFPPQLQPVSDNTGTIDYSASVARTILDYPPYLNMHNPFARFQTIVGNRSQWKRIGTSYDFLRDALDGTLPQYSWFTPDIWSCGHWLSGTEHEPPQRAPVLVDQLATWLEAFFGVLSFPGPHSRLPKDTLVVVTFDESDYNASYEQVQGWDGGYDGPNQIYTVLLGDMVEPRRIEAEGYNHYSLLKTVEKNFDLSTLGKNDLDANWFQFLWGREFRWSHPHPTPIPATTLLAAAALGESLYVVYGSDDVLKFRVKTGDTWSDEQPVPAPANVTAVAMASGNGSLTLVCQSGGALSTLSLQAGGAWSQPTPSVVSSAASFSLVSFIDYGDRAEKLMLAWSSAGGALQSQLFANGQWSTPIAVGQQTDGAVILAALGASLYLIHKAVGTNEMNVVSYNTAPFNVVTSADTTKADNSDTTQYAWSPSEFPIAHFAAGPTRGRNVESLLAPYQGLAPFAAATLDGVIHLTHASIGGSDVVTETFSISGILTPQNPVSYKQSGPGLSNGYGTLAEAGWSQQVPIPRLASKAGYAMAIALAGDELVLLSPAMSGDAVHMSIGAYR
jgi:hypothetical protein